MVTSEPFSAVMKRNLTIATWSGESAELKLTTASPSAKRDMAPIVGVERPFTV